MNSVVVPLMTAVAKTVIEKGYELDDNIAKSSDVETEDSKMGLAKHVKHVN